MSCRAFCAAARSRKSAQATNRFVRFGYRRQKPYKAYEAHPSGEAEKKLSEYPKKDSASQTWKNFLTNGNSRVSSVKQSELAAWPQIKDAFVPLIPVRSGQDPSIIPILAHGVDIVLRGDGVYPLEAPWINNRNRRSGKWERHGNSTNSQGDNHLLFYGESLRTIVHPDHIAWENIPDYVPAESDTKLQKLAEHAEGVHFYSSTSSITPAIGALYHLISNFRDTGLQGRLSSQIDGLPTYFSKMHRRPIAFTVKQKGLEKKLYSVNAHSGPSTGPSILRDLGHSMERMLTSSPEEFFSKYVRAKNEGKHSCHDEVMKTKTFANNEEQFYNYSKISKFLLRAQIDCRNGNTGEVFDVKTRAVAPIRYDLENYEAFSTHRLRFLRGKSDSYEREFYDMVRTVFLKYALQLRIGRMSGALVAYHNTSELLGLEYLPLKEINSYVFGSERWGNIAFATTVELLQEVIEEITRVMCRDDPKEELKVVMLTEWSRLRMYVFVQRITEGEDDPLGPAVFSEVGGNVSSIPDIATSRQEGFCDNGQLHVDSFIHQNWRGISVLGRHPNIERLGGQMLEPLQEAESYRTRKRPGSETYDYSNYDLTSLTKDRFQVWELDVAPLINEELAPKNLIHIGDGDVFKLKYKLRHIEDIRKGHVSKFVTSLGRIYSS